MIDNGTPGDKAFWQASTTPKYLWTSVVKPLKSLKAKMMSASDKSKKQNKLLADWGRQVHSVNCPCFTTDKEPQTYSLLKQSSETKAHANFEVQFCLKEWL